MAGGEGKRVEGREAPEFLEERRWKDIPSCGVEASYVRVYAPPPPPPPYHER